jgi:hypothetical protein
MPGVPSIIVGLVLVGLASRRRHERAKRLD